MSISPLLVLTTVCKNTKALCVRVFSDTNISGHIWVKPSSTNCKDMTDALFDVHIHPAAENVFNVSTALCFRC